MMVRPVLPVVLDCEGLKETQETGDCLDPMYEAHFK